jgi:hypothetical protein
MVRQDHPCPPIDYSLVPAIPDRRERDIGILGVQGFQLRLNTCDPSQNVMAAAMQKAERRRGRSDRSV